MYFRVGCSGGAAPTIHFCKVQDSTSRGRLLQLMPDAYGGAATQPRGPRPKGSAQRGARTPTHRSWPGARPDNVCGGQCSIRTAQSPAAQEFSQEWIATISNNAVFRRGQRASRSLKLSANQVPVVALANPNVALQITEIRHWAHRLLISDHLALLRPPATGGAKRASSGGAHGDRAEGKDNVWARHLSPCQLASEMHFLIIDTAE
jgi:hypothetical protein